MTDAFTPLDASCRCGLVKMKISAPPLLAMACHCRGCQKMTASAFSLSVAIPTEAFEVVAGETVMGGLHGPSRHHHCGHCLSWVFTRPEGMDWFVNVRTTMLDDPARYPPFAETYVSEKLPWASTSAPHSYDAIPPLKEFDHLIPAYAETLG